MVVCPTTHNQNGTEPGPLIPSFYAGKCVFITGASGFMGKVLIERLLSTCPDIARIHLLLRKKRDVDPQKRLVDLKKSQVFEVLRRENPSQLDKLRALCGDTSKPGLGMSAQALQHLQEISVVFHVAATLKFEEEIRTAVDENLRSVTRLLHICDTLPGIEALVYVSTAYSMAEMSEVEERVYPTKMTGDQLEAIVDNVPEAGRALLTPGLLGSKPNTYTFTKAMAEQAILQHHPKYPVAIFRPTIVISSLRHPMPGWVDNLNGPSGVVVGIGKGLLHTFHVSPNARADLIPVDIAIDTMIACAWDVATLRTNEPRVYNCTTYDNPTKWGDFERSIERNVLEQPMDKVFWYPSMNGIENHFIYKLRGFVQQTAPLYALEYITNILGIKKKISLIKASQRLKAAHKVLVFFSLREWKFHSQNVKKLRARMDSSGDSAIYNLDPGTIDWDDQYRNFVIGARRYLLRERDEDMDEARRHLRKMYYLHNGLKVTTLLCLLSILRFSTVSRSTMSGVLRLLDYIVRSSVRRVLGKSNVA